MICWLQFRTYLVNLRFWWISDSTPTCQVPLYVFHQPFRTNLSSSLYVFHQPFRINLSSSLYVFHQPFRINLSSSLYVFHQWFRINLSSSLYWTSNFSVPNYDVLGGRPSPDQCWARISILIISILIYPTHIRIKYNISNKHTRVE